VAGGGAGDAGADDDEIEIHGSFGAYAGRILRPDRVWKR
jgi:hypothetical protein